MDTVFTAPELIGQLALHKYVKCVECNGIGVITLSPTPGIDARVDFCPSCQGLGRIEDEQLLDLESDPESAPEPAQAAKAGA